MHLKNINILNYKNYEQLEVDFSPKMNCFTGMNGVGKTNLLDSVFYLSMCKSYFNPVDSHNVRHDEKFFIIDGNYHLKGETEHIYCGYKLNQKKKIKRNNKEYKKFSEHIGLLPIVMVSPSDSNLISGGSDERRKFIDTVIAQYDRQYLTSIVRYNRLLQQRNMLLKQFLAKKYFDTEMLHVYNQQMAEYGQFIYSKRKDFIEQLIPIFQYYYNFISGGKEKVDLVYESHLHKSSMENLLSEAIEKDRVLGHTSVGVHRDDLSLNIGDYAIKKSGSQGQQKTYLVALKFAQSDFIKNINQLKPILLLDDIFDKLDENRVGKIVELVANDNFGQIFITDTNTERMVDILKNSDLDYKLFYVGNSNTSNIVEEVKNIIP